MTPTTEQIAQHLELGGTIREEVTGKANGDHNFRLDWHLGKQDLFRNTAAKMAAHLAGRHSWLGTSLTLVPLTPGLAEIRADKSVVTLEFHSHGDAQGRYGYTMHWWQEEFHMGPQWRGQDFFRCPKDHIAELEARGLTVRQIPPR